MSKNTTLYDRRKGAGLCVRCGLVAPRPNRANCEDCGRRAVLAIRAQQRKKNAEGKCARCGKDGRPNRTICNRCSATQEERRTVAARERKQAGLCIRCGKRPHRPDRFECNACATKVNTKTRMERKRRIAEGVCPDCRHRPPRQGLLLCAQCALRGREKQEKVKRAVFEKYGNKCECCGLSNIWFLTIDHVHNDGAEERRRIGGSTAVLRKLYREPRSDRYQLLCFNCNGAKEFFGICPHKWDDPNIRPPFAVRTLSPLRVAHSHKKRQQCKLQSPVLPFPLIT